MTGTKETKGTTKMNIRIALIVVFASIFSCYGRGYTLEELNQNIRNLESGIDEANALQYEALMEQKRHNEWIREQEYKRQEEERKRKIAEQERIVQERKREYEEQLRRKNEERINQGRIRAQEIIRHQQAAEEALAFEREMQQYRIDRSIIQNLSGRELLLTSGNEYIISKNAPTWHAGDYVEVFEINGNVIIRNERDWSWLRAILR